MFTQKCFQISYCFILQGRKEEFFSHSTLDCSAVTPLLPSKRFGGGETHLFQVAVQGSHRMNSPREPEFYSVEEQVKLHGSEGLTVLRNLFGTSQENLLFNTSKTTYFLPHSVWTMLMNTFTWLGARRLARRTPALAIHNSSTSGILRLIFQILHQRGTTVNPEGPLLTELAVTVTSSDFSTAATSRAVFDTIKLLSHCWVAKGRHCSESKASRPSVGQRNFPQDKVTGEIAPRPCVFTPLLVLCSAAWGNPYFVHV